MSGWILYGLTGGFCVIAWIAVLVAWRLRSEVKRLRRPATWEMAVSAEDLVLKHLDGPGGNWTEWFTDGNPKGLRMVRAGGWVPMDRDHPEGPPVRMYLEVEAASGAQAARFGAEVMALARGRVPLNGNPAPPVVSEQVTGDEDMPSH